MSQPDKSERGEFLRHFPVSHGTLARLDRYAELLGEWNLKFNLVAESTLPHIWCRHFLDSMQLMRFVPKEAGTLFDLGSGAGFPGLVLNIAGIAKVRLIESTGKKADFLRAVIAELGLSAIVDQTRIENLKNLKADIITARALKPLPELLDLSKPLIKNNSLCLFLKSQKVDAELTDAAKYWKFDYETFSSLSDHSGRVLKINNLRSTGRRRKS